MELENENNYIKSHIVLHYLSDFLCSHSGRVLLHLISTHLKFCDIFTWSCAQTNKMTNFV